MCTAVGAQRGEAATVDDDEDTTFGDDEMYEEEEPRETRAEAVVGPGRLKERIRLCRQELEEALGVAKFAEAYRIARQRGWDGEYEVGGEAVDGLSDVLSVSSWWDTVCWVSGALMWRSGGLCGAPVGGALV